MGEDLEAYGEWNGLLDARQSAQALKEHFDALVDAADRPVEISRKEWIVLILRRIYSSSLLTLIYVGVLVLNIVLIAVTFMSPASATSVWFLLAEAMITAAVVNEVALRLVLVGCDFFYSCSNIFDFLVALCCILLVILSTGARDWSEGAMADVELTFVLLLYRVAVSVMRVVVIAKRHWYQQRSHDVDFSSGGLDVGKLDDDL